MGVHSSNRIYDGVIMDPIYKNFSTNKRWTFLFFFVYAIIFCVTGYAIGSSNGINGIITGFVGFLFILFICYYNGEDVVTDMSSAKDI